MHSPQSVTRVMHILELLCASPEPVSLARMSRDMSAPKSSLASLLRGLAQADFVTASDGGYRLGPAAFGLGSALLDARRHLHSSDLVREGMRRLAQQTGETVLFAVLDAGADSMTYVDMIESRNAVRFSASLGDRRPLYCTAGGRVLLAKLPEQALRDYLKRLKPRKLATGTETDKRQLTDAIAKVRESGIAQTIDQAEDGVTGTAAAVQDASGTVIGALVVAAPTARIPDRADSLVQAVKAEAAAISRNLGHRISSRPG